MTVLARIRVSPRAICNYSLSVFVQEEVGRNLAAKEHRLFSEFVWGINVCARSFFFPPTLPKVESGSFSESMKAEKDVEEVNKDKQNTGVCPTTQHPTLTNKQRGNEVTVRPATLDGKQHCAPKQK